MDKKILSIQDVSCYGQCSLTVALPILSAFGFETAIIPSAVLSTHTGGFTGFTFRDLTEDLPLIENHWNKENIKFDYIYTGYIGSEKQLGYIESIIKSSKKDDALVIIDPAMGDNGKLYFGFDKNFANRMAKFCKNADYIIPNLTEAAFMLDEPYLGDNYSFEDVENVIYKLREKICNKSIIITGVSFDDKTTGIAHLEFGKEKVEYFSHEKISGRYHGTGDVFSSCFVGCIAKGMSVEKACEFAGLFVVDAIKKTIDDDTHKYGVKFEKSLPLILKIQ